jgi:hypothetical protein
MMGCSTGNSKSQLHKARMKLRTLLQRSRAQRIPQRSVRKKAARNARQPVFRRDTIPSALSANLDSGNASSQVIAA